MLSDVYHDVETSTYSLPALCLPAISGLTMPANQAPDTGAAGTVAYMHITSYGGPSGGTLDQISILPIITNRGLAYGGEMGTVGTHVAPKLALEGYIDTPCVQVGEYYLPQPIDSKGIRYTYAEIIVMMFEGRANSSSSGWERLDPIWYRDPWGRQYNAPRILDFSGTYVEGVPERVQFTMTLKVN